MSLATPPPPLHPLPTTLSARGKASGGEGQRDIGREGGHLGEREGGRDGGRKGGREEEREGGREGGRKRGRSEETCPPTLLGLTAFRARRRAMRLSWILAVSKPVFPIAQCMLPCSVSCVRPHPTASVCVSRRVCVCVCPRVKTRRKDTSQKHAASCHDSCHLMRSMPLHHLTARG